MTTIESTRPWWTVSQIAQAAGCHRQTVLIAVWRGDLPSFRIGRAYAVPGAEAMGYIESWRSGGVQ
jgi:excisionase family DNA binding protein